MDTFLTKNIKKVNSSQNHNENLEILSILREIEVYLNSMYNQFEFITDPTLIDSCIYDINSAQNKYSYYLRLYKSRNIS